MSLQNVLDPTKSKSFRLEDLFGGVSKAYLIGVSAYQNDIPPLSGPSKDIKLLAETFDSQGFETISMLNEEASFDN
ncbi:MAG: caspase family protein, partial [Bacteroidota bacterium]